jgi:hypothetical protein
MFPDEQVVADRLNQNNYDIGHIIPIVNINDFLYGWISENNEEYICDCCCSVFRLNFCTRKIFPQGIPQPLCQ